MYGADTDLWMTKRICPICGKTFYTAGSLWAYKEQSYIRPSGTIHKQKKKYYCSWKCLCQKRKDHPRKERIDDYIY